MGNMYGFDIGGTKIEFAVFNDKLEALYTQRAPTPRDDYTQFIQVLTEFIHTYDVKSNITGTVGIGLPGQQTPDGMTRCNNIPCIDGSYLQADLEKLLGRPIKIANDANCFALSEACEKNLIGASSVLALILGTGFGAGLVINGRLYAGHNGAGLEVGHTRLPWDAQELLGNDFPLVSCRCGRVGCLDHYLSGRGYADLYNQNHNTCQNHYISAEEITTRYYQGEPEAILHTNRYLELLATCISGFVSILDPEVIIFGGGLSNFNAIYDRLPALLDKHALNGSPPPLFEKLRLVIQEESEAPHY
ncbi:ROK family protein [Endozoicomonas atrinae]|uniref:ROK family protein n=1 Tax=Endozoicomonas atrinae TaxID=1333660 RepID=UPI000AC770FD|nr:ROK family protein [Endozoicomonas atrinae]